MPCYILLPYYRFWFKLHNTICFFFLIISRMNLSHISWCIYLKLIVNWYKICLLKSEFSLLLYLNLTSSRSYMINDKILTSFIIHSVSGRANTKRGRQKWRGMKDGLAYNEKMSFYFLFLLLTYPILGPKICCCYYQI